MASKLKKNNRNAGSVSGVSLQSELDLTTKDFSKSIKGPDMLGMSKCTVSIQCISATGTSGNVKIEQGIDVNPSLHKPFSPAVVIALGTNTNNAEFDIPLGGTHVSVDLSGATLGVLGKILITFIGKRG